MLTFQAEIDAFKEALPELLAKHHEGDFVILKDCQVRHVCGTYQEALSWGYRTYGLDDDFFVKELSTTPQVCHFRRL